MRLWKEKSGVSAVIGAILMFTILTGLYVSIQVSQVPVWNRQLEFASFEAAYSDMLFLKADIAQVAAVQAPKSTAIRMGTRYPDRPFFTNAGAGVAGSLTKEDMTVTVQYVVDFPGDPTTTLTYPSSRLIYEARGSIGAKIVYEHGLIIREFATGNVTTDKQALIVTDELYVPVLYAALFTPVSSLETAPITLKPYTEINTSPKIKSVTITLPTAYPEVWADRLAGLDTAKTTVTVNQVAKTIIINSTAIKQIAYPTDPGTESGLYAGLISFSTKTISGFDPSTDFPRIYNVVFEAIGGSTYKKTHTRITATVKNATAPYDIHADLTDLTSDVLKFDVPPDYSSPDSITAGSWTVPNTNTVQWQDITHPEFPAGAAVAVTFSIYNSVLNQQYTMTAITIRQSSDNWQQ